LTRIAHCCCGSLRLEVTGDPALVGLCHCTQCQRRTGSPFSAVTIFPKDRVRIEGPRKVYQRSSDSGRKVAYQFCPDCGSTVFWHAQFAPNFVLIAIGSFAEPSLPQPTMSVWEKTKYPWVKFDHELTHFEGQAEL
jgi:hypothetical protein